MEIPLTQPEDTTKELQIAIAYAQNDGDPGAASSAAKYLDDCLYNDKLPTRSPEEFTGRTAMDRLEAHQEINKTRKDVQIKGAYVDRDAWKNRDKRLENIETKLIALKAYDTIALSIRDIKRLLKNITDTL